MKNYFFYTIIILFFITNFSDTLFAQSANEKHKALNDYFETIIKDTTQVAYVAKEKINSNETLDMFGLNHIVAVDLLGNGIGEGTLYKKKYFEKMKKEYKDKCVPGKRIWCNDDYWTKDNFVNKKIVFECMNTDKEIELIFQKYNNYNIKVYGLSEPNLLSKQKIYHFYCNSIILIWSASIYCNNGKIK